MNDFQATALMIGLFALRCIVPLALTLVIGYLMNRLVDRWKAEEAAAEEEMVASDDQLEGLIVPDPAGSPRPAIKLPVITIPCWLINNCEPQKRAKCPAYNQPGLPCWLVHMMGSGKLSRSCPDCPIYARAMPIYAKVSQ